MADGAIIIETKLRTKEATAELNNLKKSLSAMEAQLKKQEQTAENLAKRYREQAAAVEEARKAAEAQTAKRQATEARLAQADREYEAAIKRQEAATTPAEAKAMDETIRSMGANAAQLSKEYERQQALEQSANANLEQQQAKLDGIVQAQTENKANIQASKGAIADQTVLIEQQAETLKRANFGQTLAEGFKALAKPLDAVGRRIKMMVKRLLLFSVISKAIRSVREYFSQAMKSSGEFQQAVSNLKGALRVAFQPVTDVIIPALTRLINTLAKAAQAIASFMATLFGSTLEQTQANAAAMYDEANAISAAGGAAGKAGKQMANFDEINQLSGSGGGGGSSAVKPNFDFDVDDGITDKLKTIMDIVSAIGIGLAAWSISSKFKASLTETAGIAMTAAGAFLLAKGTIDAWNNGVDWGNTIEMISGAALAIGGLYLAFGPIAGGIAALVAGIAMLVVGIRDFIQTGELTHQTALLIASGITAIGVGLSLLTGSWIPLAIASIVSVALVIYSYWDEIKAFFVKTWEKIKELASDAWDFIKGVWEKVSGWFDTNVIQPIKDLFQPFFDWITALFEDIWLIIQAVWKVASEWFNTTVIQPIVVFFTALWNTISTAAKETWDGLKEDWATLTAWIDEHVIQPISKAFSGLWEGIKTAAVSAFNFIMEKIEAFINHIIDSINSFCDKINGVAAWAGNIVGKDWNIIPQINHVTLPRLAEGAVIPANHEFAAILGDQKSGTNIETPLSTMVQAFKQALGEAGGNRTIILELDKRQFAQITFDAFKMESGRKGIRLGENSV